MVDKLPTEPFRVGTMVKVVVISYYFCMEGVIKYQTTDGGYMVAFGYETANTYYETVFSGWELEVTGLDETAEARFSNERW